MERTLSRSSITRGREDLSRKFFKSGSFRTSFMGISLVSLLPEEHEWVCAACSYQNVDCHNNKCSVCGLEQDDPILPTPELCSMSSSESSLFSTTSAEEDCPANALSPTREPKQANESLTRGEYEFLSRSYDAEPNNSAPIGQHTTKKEEWECGLCTYINDDPLHLICAVCGHKRDHEKLKEEQTDDLTLRRKSVSEDQAFYMQRLQKQTEDAELKALRGKIMEELISLQSEILEDLQGDKDHHTGDT